MDKHTRKDTHTKWGSILRGAIAPLVDVHTIRQEKKYSIERRDNQEGNREKENGLTKMNGAGVV